MAAKASNQPSDAENCIVLKGCCRAAEMMAIAMRGTSAGRLAELSK